MPEFLIQSNSYLSIEFNSIKKTLVCPLIIDVYYSAPPNVAFNQKQIENKA